MLQTTCQLTSKCLSTEDYQPEQNYLVSMNIYLYLIKCIAPPISYQFGVEKQVFNKKDFFKIHGYCLLFKRKWYWLIELIIMSWKHSKYKIKKYFGSIIFSNVPKLRLAWTIYIFVIFSAILYGQKVCLAFPDPAPATRTRGCKRISGNCFLNSFANIFAYLVEETKVCAASVYKTSLV